MQFSLARGQLPHWYYQQEEEQRENGNTSGSPSNDAVVPRKNGKFIQPSYQIPPGCDVAGYEYAKGEDGERVHEAALLLYH